MRKSFCYFWLSQKVESPLSFKTQIHQQFHNSAESRIPNRRISHAKCKIAESRTQNANPPSILQRRISKKFLLLLAYPKSRIPLTLPTLIYQRFHNSTESRIPNRRISHAKHKIVESTRKAQNRRISHAKHKFHRISHEVRKNFYFASSL